MDDGKTKRVPISGLRSEDGVEDLLDLPEMQPYIELAMAALSGNDPRPELQTIAQLPLEKRYIWRVASALKWAFADFDHVNVMADRDTLTPEDLTKVSRLLEHRPIQFCMFLTALVGPEQMQRMMVEAIKIARMDLR